MPSVSFVRGRPNRPASTPPRYSQSENRHRRRRWLSVALDGSFDLAVEVAEIVTPIAELIASEPAPRRYEFDALDLSDAVHELVTAIGNLLVDHDAREHLERLAPEDSARARAALRALAGQPPRPVIEPEELRDSSWASAVVDIARPYVSSLSLYLGVETQKSGLPSAVSDAVVGLLRELDHAASATRRKAQRARFAREMNPVSQPNPAADQHRATLSALGIEVRP